MKGKWIEVNHLSNGQYSVNKNTSFKTSMLTGVQLRGSNGCEPTRTEKIVPARYICAKKNKSVKKQKSIFKRDEYILIRKVFCITTRNVNIIKELLLYYVIFESVSISNYQLTHILSIH